MAERLDSLIGLGLAIVGVFVAVVAVAFVVFMVVATLADAHDDQMHRSMYSDWMNNLHNKNNAICCTNNEGSTLKDVDWSVSDGMQCIQTPIEAAQNAPLGKYCVRIDGTWWYVPDKAVIEESNKYGPAVVWPIWGSKLGEPKTVDGIRCFMPGAMG